MLFDLANRDTPYQALLNRNAAYDGQAYIDVATTCVFCRLTCPACKPKQDNCTLHASVGEYIEAGFRACKRRHPLQPIASAAPSIATLLAALYERPEYRWAESHSSSPLLQLMLSKERHQTVKVRFHSKMQGHLESTIAALVGVAGNGKSDRAKVSAASEIINRAVGRPVPV